MDSWGLSRDFAPRVAIMLAYAQSEGLNPQIQSGWRDPAKQIEMQKRWDAGQRAGLRARPATNSKHMNKAGRRASALAVDITTRNDARTAQIARALGIGTGLDFETPDPGHYYAKG